MFDIERLLQKAAAEGRVRHLLTKEEKEHITLQIEKSVTEEASRVIKILAESELSAAGLVLR